MSSIEACGTGAAMACDGPEDCGQIVNTAELAACCLNFPLFGGPSASCVGSSSCNLFSEQLCHTDADCGDSLGGLRCVRRHIDGFPIDVDVCR